MFYLFLATDHKCLCLRQKKPRGLKITNGNKKTKLEFRNLKKKSINERISRSLGALDFLEGRDLIRILIEFSILDVRGDSRQHV